MKEKKKNPKITLKREDIPEYKDLVLNCLESIYLMNENLGKVDIGLTLEGLQAMMRSHLPVDDRKVDINYLRLKVGELRKQKKVQKIDVITDNGQHFSPHYKFVPPKERKLL